MKRTVTALCLAATVGAACLGQTYYVSHSAEEAMARVEEIDRLAESGQTDAAAEACERLERDWHDKTPWLDALLFHDYVDSVDVSLAKMRVQLQHGVLPLYHAESAQAKKGLASLKGSEYPLLENIL